MLAEADIPKSKQDSGTAALVLVLRFHGIAVDPSQLAHKFGASLGATEILLCAKELQLKARQIVSEWNKLSDTPLPAIGQRPDGSFFILAKVSDDKVLVQDPAIGRPQAFDRP